MKLENVNHPDLKKKGAPTKVESKAMVLKTILPGRLKGPIPFVVDDASAIEVWKQIKPSLQKKTDKEVTKAYFQLSKRARKRIVFENPELVPFNHNERGSSVAYRVTNLERYVIEGFIGSEVPAGVSKHDWEHWNKGERLRYHFNILSEGNPYAWEYTE